MRIKHIYHNIYHIVIILNSVLKSLITKAERRFSMSHCIQQIRNIHNIEAHICIYLVGIYYIICTIYIFLHTAICTIVSYYPLQIPQSYARAFLSRHFLLQLFSDTFFIQLFPYIFFIICACKKCRLERLQNLHVNLSLEKKGAEC